MDDRSWCERRPGASVTDPDSTAEDARWMRRALALADRDFVVLVLGAVGQR